MHPSCRAINARLSIASLSDRLALRVDRREMIYPQMRRQVSQDSLLARNRLIHFAHTLDAFASRLEVIDRGQLATLALQANWLMESHRILDTIEEIPWPDEAYNQHRHAQDRVRLSHVLDSRAFARLSAGLQLAGKALQDIPTGMTDLYAAMPGYTVSAVVSRLRSLSAQAALAEDTMRLIPQSGQVRSICSSTGAAGRSSDALPALARAPALEAA